MGSCRVAQLRAEEAFVKVSVVMQVSNQVSSGQSIVHVGGLTRFMPKNSGVQARLSASCI